MIALEVPATTMYLIAAQGESGGPITGIVDEPSFIYALAFQDWQKAVGRYLDTDAMGLYLIAVDLPSGQNRVLAAYQSPASRDYDEKGCA